MRPFRLAASVAVPLLVAAGLTGCDSGAAEPTDVVIGADLSLGSTVDTAFVRGLQLRVDQINASGRLAGVRLVLRVDDNQLNPATALNNIKTLADDPSVAAIVTGRNAEFTVGAAKLIDEKRIPVVSLASAAEVSNPVTERTWVFKIGPNAADTAAALSADLKRARIKNVGIVYADDNYGRGVKAALGPALAKASIETTSAEPVNPGSKDITRTMKAVLAGRPKALIVVTDPDQALLAAISAREAKYGGELFLDAGAASDLFLPPGGDAALQNATLVYTDSLAVDDVLATTPAKAARQQWFRDYTSRYGSYSGSAAFAADAVDLIAAGLSAPVDRTHIRDVIETAQIEGLSGVIQFSRADHSGLMAQSLTMLVARGGRWRLAASPLG